MIIPDGETLTFGCHGAKTTYLKTSKSNYLRGSQAPKVSFAEATCRNGQFEYNKQNLNAETLSCSFKNEPKIIKTQSNCSPQGTDGRTKKLKLLFLVTIGWQFNDNYRTQISLCLDEIDYGTLWTSHTVVGRSIDYRDMDPGRPSFRADVTRHKKRFFTFTSSTGLNRMYRKTNQAKQVKVILGSNSWNGIDPLIETSSRGTHYFAKGHLSPDAAFVYNTQQDATYYFMNVAPQIQSFNNGNWKALEMAVRSYAGKTRKDLSIHTGTFGNLNFNRKSIYLYREKFVPAPEYYWKVVHDKAEGKAMAFVGWNNVFSSKQSPKLLCENVCSQWSEVDWDIENVDGGYMYCCRVQDLRKAIPYVPDIQADLLMD